MSGLDRSALRRTTALVTVVAFAFSLSVQAAPRAQEPPAPAVRSKLQIQHDPLPCVTTVAGAAVDALVNPGPDVSVSRVLWRAAKQLPFYYYTLMTGQPPSLEGIIPRPEETTTAVEYYVEAVDRASLSRKTPDYVAPVVKSNVCKRKQVAAGKDGLGLTIGLTDPQQPAVPPGFRKEDIAKVILINGTVVTLAAAMQMTGESAPAGGAAGASSAGAGAAGAGAAGAGAAGAGAGAAGAGAGAAGAGAAAGGISTGVLVGAGAVVVAGAAVAVAASSSKSTPTPVPPTPTPTPTPVINRFVEVEVTWSGQEGIEIKLLDSSNTSVGQGVPVGCGPTASRTARVVLQGTTVPGGAYRVTLAGQRCGASTFTPIAALLNAHTDTSAIGACTTFFNVPSETATTACSFTLP